MARRKNISLAQCKAALKKHLGAVAPAARLLKISYQTLSQRIDEHPELQDFIAKMEADVIRRARSTVIDAVNKGDKGMAKWLLERRDKQYANKQQTELVIPDEQLAGLVVAFGGNLDALRSLRASLDPTAPQK